MDNLNEMSIFAEKEYNVSGKRQNNNIKVINPTFDSVEVVTYEIKRRLIQLIEANKDRMIFGSVAWLTDFDILDALAKCKNVQILVQKEDFLRPDGSNTDNWKKVLHQKYNALRFQYARFQMMKPINCLSFCYLYNIEPIRCIGNHNKDKKAAMPRAHNKFLVFCDYGYDPQSENPDELKYDAKIVWTGSFNFSQNAGRSLENAIILADESGTNPILNAYLKEHHDIFKFSEQLDWESDWCMPEYRIGT